MKGAIQFWALYGGVIKTTLFVGVVIVPIGSTAYFLHKKVSSVNDAVNEITTSIARWKDSTLTKASNIRKSLEDEIGKKTEQMSKIQVSIREKAEDTQKILRENLEITQQRVREHQTDVREKLTEKKDLLLEKATNVRKQMDEKRDAATENLQIHSENIKNKLKDFQFGMKMPEKSSERIATVDKEEAGVKNKDHSNEKQ